MIYRVQSGNIEAFLEIGESWGLNLDGGGDGRILGDLPRAQALDLTKNYFIFSSTMMNM